jgi:ribulose-phosphate 3-epimerase
MPLHPIRIAPSVIAADFGDLKSELARIEDAGADLLHVDIMDGNFVPNITFGPFIVQKIKSLTKLPLDVHLMITQPRRFLLSFVEAGADTITFHVETETYPNVPLAELKSFDVKKGMTLRPRTPLSAVTDYFSQLDRLLIMTVEPGFGGQKFMPDMLAKIREARALRDKHGYTFDIEVDGGLDIWTVVDAVHAGAETIVAGSSLFKNPDLTAAVKALRESADYAAANPPSPEAAPAPA